MSATKTRSAHPLLAASAFILSAVALAATPSSARAQSPVPTPPQIIVSANGEVVISPDRANIQLGVETQAKTAALASADNNRKQTAVLNAIKALGIPASSITTSNYSVSPVQRWDEKERKTVIDGYRVSNIVVVNVAKIDQSGAVIDAALSNGSNRVAGLNFELADPSKAREEAITKAVAQARREAEVAAKAAGGSLGGLLELTVNSFEQPRPLPMFAMAKMASADGGPTPVSEGTLTIQVGVTTRWSFK
ncbi:MAG: SIMPL domain-containing protein [Phycisphaerae bacterium]|nr:SIMPL domain-containing protein [Gemmatimonadaceae bacterium]